MATPQEVNVHNLNGSWDMNKKLSDDTTAMLKQQGLPWLVRQAAAYSAVQVNLKQYTGEDGLLHLDQEQISTGGVTQLEPRIMNGEWGDREVQYWGKVKGKNRYAKLSEVEEPFLKEGWAQECIDGDVIESYTESRTDTWTAMQVWGFAEIEGQRKHVRRVYAKKGKDVHKVKLVYDWKTT